MGFRAATCEHCGAPVTSEDVEQTIWEWDSSRKSLWDARLIVVHLHRGCLEPWRVARDVREAFG